MRILIVEDSANDRRLLRLILEKHGCRVSEAADGLQGLEMARRELPELIVSDALMPQMDGFELLREVRRDAALAAIPFVFYSAVYTGEKEEELALSLGAAAFLIKPMEPEELWSRLREATARHRPPPPLTGDENFLPRYSRIVATKLEEKVRELELELARRKQLEAEREKIIAELGASNRDLSNLSEVVSDSFSTLNLDEMLRLFLTRIVKALGADSAAVYLKYGERLRVRASVGMDKSLATKFSVAVGEGVAGAIAATGRPLFIPDVANDQRVVNPELLEIGSVSLLGAPILHGGEVLGAVHACWKAAHAENERERLLLAVTAERCANAIANCSLFERSEKIREHLDLQIRRMPLAHIVWDRNFTVQSWNPEAEHIFGFTAEEAIGRHPFDLIVAEDVQPAVQEIWQRLLTGPADTAVQSINANITKDRRTIFCEWHNIALRREEDGIEGVLSMVLDVTARQEAQQKLRQAKEEWERTFDAMPDVVMILDKDYRVLSCNQATALILGTPVKELIGRKCHETLWGNSGQCQGCPAQSTLADGREHSAEISNTGLAKDFLVTTTPLLDDQGRIDRVIHVARDITDQKQMDARLRKAQKMEAIGTLAGGIAHDFNNILSAVLGYAELIRVNLPPGTATAADIDQVILAGKRATELVRQILTFSRQTEQKRQPLRVQFIAKEALKLLRPTLPATIEIRQDIDNDCPEIEADPSQIHQVIMNLCTNAYQAMVDRGGLLVLALKTRHVSQEEAALQPEASAGDFILLEVSDTGCGMTPETMNKIFEPYFTTRKDRGGTGLGLAMVHGIVRGHGGYLTVYSEPGRGSTFKVYLPAMRRLPVRQAETVIDEALLPGGGERILFVDDEQPLADLGQRLLQPLGYRVVTARGSEAALALFLADPDAYDLVITDLAMPHMDGIELARRMRAQRPALPVILCSGFGDPAKRELAGQTGIRLCLTKPLLRQDLAKAIRSVLDALPG